MWYGVDKYRKACDVFELISLQFHVIRLHCAISIVRCLKVKIRQVIPWNLRLDLHIFTLPTSDTQKRVAAPGPWLVCALVTDNSEHY
jgi:hypothetical protein